MEYPTLPSGSNCRRCEVLLQLSQVHQLYGFVPQFGIYLFTQGNCPNTLQRCIARLGANHFHELPDEVFAALDVGHIDGAAVSSGEAETGTVLSKSPCYAD